VPTTSTATRRRRSAPADHQPHGGQASLRVATLTRISTDEINQPYSLESQATSLDAFVASQPSLTITHRFVDQASGATLDRPGLQDALAAARNGEFDILLVYRIDRLTRSIVGLMTIVEELEAAGVALKSATEPIDTQGPVGRMLLQLLGIFAEFERNLLIDRITAGFERKASRGEWLSGRAPYGYTLDSTRKTLTVNPDESVMVQAIFAKYTDERLGAKAIANWLNDTGRRTRTGKLWTGQTILRILRNHAYRGKITHDNTIHDGKHDAIVDADTFQTAQTLLDAQAADAVDRAPASDYLLSGLTRCVSCGGAYIGAGAQGKNRYYRYYVCRTHQTKGRHGCRSQRVPAEPLETAIIDALVNTYANLDEFQQALETARTQLDDDRPRLEAELAATDTQIRDTTATLDRYLRAFETGSMPDHICAPRVEDLAAQRDDLTRRRHEIATALDRTPTTPARDHLEDIAATLQRTITDGPPAVVKDLLAGLIASIDMLPDRHAQPIFKLPDLPNSSAPEPYKARAQWTGVRMGSRNVELRGIEPLASSMRPRRSTN
jgi:site-specific DNA recombinase